MKLKYKPLLLGAVFLLVFGFSFYRNTAEVQAKDDNTATASSDAKGSPDDDISGFKLNLSSKVIVKGKFFTLRAYGVEETQNVVFTSSDEEIISLEVHSDYKTRAVLTANKIGTATVTVSLIEKGAVLSTATCEITVGPPAISVTLTLEELTLEVNQKASLKTILKPKNTVEVATFFSSNTDIITVSAGGKITAKAPGEAVIYAQIEAENEDGKKKFAKCIITVLSVTPDNVKPSTSASVN